MKKILMFSLLIAVTSHVFAVPAITKSVSAGTTFKITETLSEKLPTGYKVKIDLNNGKGLVAMTCSGTTCTLSSNALPKVDTSMYKVGIYDAKGVLQGATTNGSYVIVSTIVTTGYTKISNSGAVLPDVANLGSGDNDWACTKDDKTGLTWEVKTDDGGLRDKDWAYSWYQPSGDNGGNVGYTDVDKKWGRPKCSTNDNCNTYAFTNAVNAKGLCGKNDWRMPTIDELKGLVTMKTMVNQPLNASLYINANYFPNINYWYWSSSPYADGISYLWDVYFYGRRSDCYGKGCSGFVLLVR
jgi:hypothetical protein